MSSVSGSAGVGGGLATTNLGTSTREVSRPGQTAEELFAESDADGDGMLSGSEFAALLAQASGGHGGGVASPAAGETEAEAAAAAPATWTSRVICCILYSQTTQTAGSGEAGAAPQADAIGSGRGGLILPTVENAEALANTFSLAMEQALSVAGIPSDPPFTLSMDPNTDDMKVSGDRSDLDKIDELLKGRPDLRQLYRTAAAVASHAYAVQDALNFQQAYRQSDNPVAIVAQFAYLFSPRPPADISMSFGSDGGQLLFDGKPAEAQDGTVA